MYLMKNKPNTLIVYVHLGPSKSNTIIPYSKIASKFLPEAQMVLITDKKNNWSHFPGTVIEYIKFDLAKYAVKKSTIYQMKKVAHGYWFYSLERIFALKSLAKYFHENSNVIHLESDVLSFIDTDLLNSLKKNTSKTSVPRYSESRGIASILYSNSINQLNEDLTKLEKLLGSHKQWINDMEILGLALNSGILQELPTTIESSFKMDNSDRLIFDGAAIGQFLFGRDALHDGGSIISGYINPDSPIKLEACNIESEMDRIVISDTSSGASIRLANLHIHSKIVFIDWEDFLSLFQRVTFSLSHNIKTVLKTDVVDKIHTHNGNLIARIIRFFHSKFNIS